MKRHRRLKCRARSSEGFRGAPGWGRANAQCHNGWVIIAAADGSSLSNPGPAGWAWYIDDDHWAAGGWPHGTNNMGELMAVLDLVRQTAEAPDEPLMVLCDSQYVVNSVTKWMPGWKRRGWRKADGKPVLNLDLLKALDEALVGRDVRFEWVKGHAGHPMNEAADDRARAAALAYQQGRPVVTGPGFRGTGMASPAPSGAEPALGESLDVEPSRPAPEPDLFTDTHESADPDLDQVVALEKSLLTDTVRANQARVRELLHPDFSEHGASGRIWSRARMLSTVEPLASRTTLEVLMVVKLAPAVVLLRSRSRSSQAVALRSSVWVHHDGRWQLYFHQGTSVDDQG